MYVTNADSKVRRFADTVSQAGLGLKPMSVQPALAPAAIRRIQPRAVVLDSNLAGEMLAVIEAVQRHGMGAMVLSDRDLPALGRLLR